MELERYVDINSEWIKLQRNDGSISSSLKYIKFEEITEKLAFEIVKLFVGSDNPNYNELSVDYLTFVKPAFGQKNVISYVYDWGGSSLIFLRFYENKSGNVRFLISLEG